MVQSPELLSSTAQKTMSFAIFVPLDVGSWSNTRRNGGAKLGVHKWGSGVNENDGPGDAACDVGGFIWIPQLAVTGGMAGDFRETDEGERDGGPNPSGRI